MEKRSKRTEVDYNVYILSIDEQKKPLRLMKKTLEHGCLVGDRNSQQRMIGCHLDGWLILLKNGKHICTETSIPVPNDMIWGPDLRLDLVASYQEMKVILSHNPSIHQDFVMVMLVLCPLHWESYHDNRQICFWRHGDRTWTSLGIEDEEPWRRCHDIAFDNNTLLYTLKVNRSFVVETWDFSQGLPEKKMTIIPWSCVSQYIHYGESRLVLSRSGEIFIAAYDYLWVLLKLDLNNKTCGESISLNGGVALLCGDSGLLFSNTDVERRGYKLNSIYFANCGQGVDKKMATYSAQDGKVHSKIWRQSDFKTFRYPEHLLLSACWMDLSTAVCS